MKKQFILALILMGTLALSTSLVNSQSSDPETVAILDFQDQKLISLSSAELDFVGSLTVGVGSRSFTVYCMSEENVSITIDTNELFDNSTGSIFSEEKIIIFPSIFVLAPAQIQKVTVNFNTDDVVAGTYRGTLILVASTENGTTSSSEITINAKITEGTVESFFTSIKSIFIIVILVLSVVGYLYPESWWPKKQYLVIGVAVIVSYLWVYLLLNNGFEDPESIISAIILTPYLTFTANYLTDKRSQRIDKEKTAVSVRNAGLKDDINLIRTVLGELTTHFANFTPDYYLVDPSKPTKTAKLLFNMGNGKLSREIWDKSTKQGVIANITVLEIEKYYEFIDLYNQYYSCAVFLSENMSQKNFEQLLDIPFFTKFDDFREKYGKLENVLFLNLSYYLGLFNKTNLSPLNQEYPRFTRTLLKSLVDYGLLDAKKDFPPVNLGCDEDTFIERFEKKYLKKFDEPELNRLFTEDTYKAGKTENFNYWKVEHKKKEKAKLRIEEFKINASQLKKILEKIYNKENIPKFYCRVEADFEKRYRELRDSIDGLVKCAPLPNYCVGKILEANFYKNNKLRVELIDELTKIKGIQNEINYDAVRSKLSKKYYALLFADAKLKKAVADLEKGLESIKKQHGPDEYVDKKTELFRTFLGLK